MPIYKGSQKIQTIKAPGADGKIGKVYKGSTLVYEGVKQGWYKWNTTTPNIFVVGDAKGERFLFIYGINYQEYVANDGRNHQMTKQIIYSITGTLGTQGSRVVGKYITQTGSSGGNGGGNYTETLTSGNDAIYYYYENNRGWLTCAYVLPGSVVNSNIVVPHSSWDGYGCNGFVFDNKNGNDITGKIFNNNNVTYTVTITGEKTHLDSFS